MSSLSDDDPLSDNQFNASSSSDDDSFPPPPLSQNYFAPPFYGRPPTPLPPSPSLTSLLRPSRPTTPDQSDDDIELVQRASPKIPTYEYYGFVVYLFSSLTFLIYLLWAYLPSPLLHALGIYYYPNRCKGRIRLKGAGERKQITDEMARQLDWKGIWNTGTDAVMDVPLAGVCEVLYGGQVDEDEEKRYNGSHSDTLGLS
ncbi:hypothetical protein E0Z10_g2340 [Xylaria hypoxylon]|uniref:PIG-P domain-containing protein n=1 Tax=Xylaria hypoxylon TaxID=37992 RepID=A0A4Z0YPZ7_9PEZI|nr:hypothetical protein E0Z10_g2340 [Xylaria hypoxylon]